MLGCECPMNCKQMGIKIEWEIWTLTLLELGTLCILLTYSHSSMQYPSSCSCKKKIKQLSLNKRISCRHKKMDEQSNKLLPHIDENQGVKGPNFSATRLIKTSLTIRNVYKGEYVPWDKQKQLANYRPPISNHTITKNQRSCGNGLFDILWSRNGWLTNQQGNPKAPNDFQYTAHSNNFHHFSA